MHFKSYSNSEEYFYSRFKSNLLFFEEFTNESHRIQRDINNFRIVVLGAGGIGSTVLMNLVGLGFRRITIVDYDLVELKNFSRQFIYEDEDIGKSKVSSVINRLKRVDPFIEIIGIEKKITSVDDILPILEFSDLVISCVDSPPQVQDWVNEACVRRKIPFVVGGIQGVQGAYYSVLPGKSGCFKCLQLKLNKAGMSALTDEKIVTVNRAMGPMASQIGGMVSMEAVRILTNFSPPISQGKFKIVNFSNGEITDGITWEIFEGCPICGDIQALHSNNSFNKNLGQYIALKELTINKQGDEYIIGRLGGDDFALFPEIGFKIIHLMQIGTPLNTLQEKINIIAGEQVDLSDFISTIDELGFIDHASSSTYQSTVNLNSPTHPKVVSWIAKILFSRFAWLIYGSMSIFSLFILLSIEKYRPNYESIIFVPDIVASISALIIVRTIIVLFHEFYHYLSMVNLNLGAKISISYRLFFPVLQTDLTEIWSLPRNKRYLPLLAGLAFDVVVLFFALLLKILWSNEIIDLNPILERFLGAIALVQIISIFFQFLIFLRTDIYGAFVHIFGCFNLFEVSLLKVKSLFVKLSRTENIVLSEAHRNDLRMSKWFSVLSIFGASAMFYIFIFNVIPSTTLLLSWMIGTLKTEPIHSVRFLEAFFVTVATSLAFITPFYLSVTQLVSSRRRNNVV
jgi:molybdopterin-synthase adenylyltransferase